MTVLAYPRLEEGPENVRFWPLFNTVSMTSPFTRELQTLEYPGAQWQASLSWPVMDEADWRKLTAFLIRLRGASGRFNYGPEHATAPQGEDEPAELYFDDDTTFDDETGFYEAPVSPFIDGAQTSTTTSLGTAGWEVSATVLQAGDFIGWADANGDRVLHMVVDDVTSDSTGAASITIEPPARAIPATGTDLDLYWPCCTMRLVDDQQGQAGFRSGVLADVSLEFVEAYSSSAN